MTPRRKICFGEFEADLQTAELRKLGQKVKLQDKPFQLLAVLLEQAGEMVSREELNRRLWPSSVYGSFEPSLNIAVAKLRGALADSPKSPRFIETVASKGYRFLAPVKTKRTQPSNGKLKTRLGRKPGRLRLAVLPFENLSGDPRQENFGYGITEEMITQLGHLYSRRLSVIAPVSIRQYMRSSASLDRITRSVAVDYVAVDYIVAGSVRSLGDRVRITARLIRVSDQAHVWAETYERRLNDVFQVQGEVAGSIVGSLGSQLLSARQLAFLRGGTTNVDASAVSPRRLSPGQTRQGGAPKQHLLLRTRKRRSAEAAGGVRQSLQTTLRPTF